MYHFTAKYNLGQKGAQASEISRFLYTNYASTRCKMCNNNTSEDELHFLFVVTHMLSMHSLSDQMCVNNI